MQEQRQRKRLDRAPAPTGSELVCRLLEAVAMLAVTPRSKLARVVTGIIMALTFSLTGCDTTGPDAPAQLSPTLGGTREFGKLCTADGQCATPWYCEPTVAGYRCSVDCASDRSCPQGARCVQGYCI